MARRRASPTLVESEHARITRMLQALLAELAAPLMRVGITPRLFGELAAQAFVKAACQASTLRNGRINQSRVAVLTGLSRPEVRKLMRGPRTAGSRYQPRTMRVLDGWISDPRYTARGGAPRALPVSGGRLSFGSLVKKYAGDVPPHALLEELRRLELVRQEGRQVQLVAPVASTSSVLARSLGSVLALASDGVALTLAPKAVAAQGIHRLTLRASDARDAIAMYERAITNAASFISGLDQSLRTGASARKTKKRGSRIVVSVLVRLKEPASKARRHRNVPRD